MTKSYVIPAGNLNKSRPPLGTERDHAASRISKTITGLMCRHERCYWVTVLPPGASCEYVGVSDMRIWFGLPNGKGVVTYPHSQVNALAIADPFTEGESWLKIRVGEGNWEFNVGDVEEAKGLFKKISVFAFPDRSSRDAVNVINLAGSSRRRRSV